MRDGEPLSVPLFSLSSFFPHLLSRHPTPPLPAPDYRREEKQLGKSSKVSGRRGVGVVAYVVACQEAFVLARMFP